LNTCDGQEGLILLKYNCILSKCHGSPILNSTEGELSNFKPVIAGRLKGDETISQGNDRINDRAMYDRNNLHLRDWSGTKKGILRLEKIWQRE